MVDHSEPAANGGKDPAEGIASSSASRDALEIEKLSLEIRDLRRPWYKKPAYILPSVVVFGTLATGVLTQFFQAEFTKFENQKHDLQRDNGDLVEEKRRLQGDSDELNAKIKALRQDQEKLRTQSKELSNRGKEVAGQLIGVNSQRKALLAERIRLQDQQHRMEVDYKQKGSELQRSLDTKNAEYAQRSTELENKLEAQQNDSDTKIALIQQRLIVSPVLKALADLCQDDVLSLSFKPDDLVRILLENEVDRPVRAAIVEDALAKSNDPSCRGKLLYVLFGATRQEIWKDQLSSLVRSEAADIPMNFWRVLSGDAWDDSPAMCELGIVILKAHPPNQQARPAAHSSEGKPGDRIASLRAEPAEMQNEIDSTDRVFMLGICAKLRKHIDRPSDFSEPQLFFTGVKMARDLALQRSSNSEYARYGALNALYALSRPAAYVVSMKLLSEFPAPKPGRLSVLDLRMVVQKRAVEVALEAEAATHTHSKIPKGWFGQSDG